MRIYGLLLVLALISCKTSDIKVKDMMFLSGKYQVIQLADKDLSNQRYITTVDTTQKSLSGKFDCNNYNINYTITEEEHIEFGYGISTKMYCDGKMELENTFFKNTSSITQFNFDGEILNFTNKDEDVILKLKLIKE